MDKKVYLRKIIEGQLITAKHKTFVESENSLATLQSYLRGICMGLYIFDEINWEEYMMYKGIIDTGIEALSKERGC